MRKQNRRGREGKDSVLPLYRNCFDTVSLLHEFSICLCQIHYFKPQSCQMLVFYGMLTWQADLSVESVSFSQSWDLQLEDVHAPLATKCQLCSPSELAKQITISGTKQLSSESVLLHGKNLTL